MAGLGTVTESAIYSQRNQDAAVMMAAEGSLSHTPVGGWSCYTADGATAAGRSNLALGLSGVGAIDAYMQDFGANNTGVGHRRTMLYPQVQEMGTGDVPFGGGNSDAKVPSTVYGEWSSLIVRQCNRTARQLNGVILTTNRSIMFWKTGGYFKAMVKHRRSPRET